MHQRSVHGPSNNRRRRLSFPQISLFALGLLLMLTLASVGHATSDDSYSPGQAIVTSDVLPVHTEMSSRSRVLETLSKGERVVVRMEMFGPGSDGPWCGVSIHGGSDMVGFVQCAHLNRNKIQDQEWQQVGEATTSSPEPLSTETKVAVRGNHVLLPVTLTHDYTSKTVDLVLDTGASRTVITSEVASRLHIRLDQSRKIFLETAGGELITAHLVKLDSIEVGPNRKEGFVVAVIDRQQAVNHIDGLLGMDFLRDFHYQIDLNRQSIHWNGQ